VYKLLVSLFDVVARVVDAVWNAFSDGRSFGRLLGVVGALLVCLSLLGTFATQSPEAWGESEDQASELLRVPPNLLEIRGAAGEPLHEPLAQGESLRMRFPAGSLEVDPDTLQVLRIEDDEPATWEPREIDGGTAIATRGSLPPGTTLALVLDQRLQDAGELEVARNVPATTQLPAGVGAVLALLIAGLLLMKRERIAFGLSIVGVVLALGTWWFWFDSQSEQPEPAQVSAVEDPAPEAEVTPQSTQDARPETELGEALEDDWLADLEAEMVADGTVDAPVDEPEPDAAGDDWLANLEAEMVADGSVDPEQLAADEAALDTPQASAEDELDLSGDMAWLAELEAEIDEAAPPAAAEALAELPPLPTTLMTLTRTGSFWSWLVGLLLLFVASLAGWVSSLDGGWDRFKVALVLGVTGLIVTVEEVAERLDRVIEWLEKATIAVFMLTMTALSFLDYLRREVPFISWEVEGGPNMATLMMVWVGFLGASLATRRGQHLSVDATDRILSPGAAKVAKRFSALVAAGLCWTLMDHSWQLTAEGLAFGDTVPGLRVWEFLIGPLNLIMSLMPQSGDVGWLAMIIGLAGAWLAIGHADQLKARGGAAEKWGAPALTALAGLLGAVGILGFLPMVWSPVLESGEAIVWKPLASGDSFPLWVGSIVIPMAFGLMALRFFVSAVLGRFTSREVGGDGPVAEVFKGGQRTRKDMIVAALFPGILLGIGATLYFGTGGLILLAGLLLVLVGAPLFVSIGVATVACVVLIDDLSGYYVAKDMFEATKKEELLAIPFFVLAGNIMTQGSLAQRLIDVARAFMGRTPGGLGLATIFACVVFAAISGSSPVTVIAIGGLMYPMLVRDGYSKSYATGVLSTAGSLGIIIPPSIPMILYAVVVSDPRRPMSPNDLFLAGVGPGLFIALALVAYTLYRTRPAGEGARIAPPLMLGGYWANLGRAMKKGFLALMLPVIILGGIYGVFGVFGIRFTVTEAAAVAVVYALFVEMVVHRELTVRKLWDVLIDSGVMMGSLFVIIVLAIAFNKFLAHQEIPQRATEWLSMHVDSKLQFLIMVNIFLLALGCVMEIISAILIVAPLLAPIAASYGIDPIHFGIIFIVNLELGYLTPPMGINLFVASTVFERPIVKVIKSVMPFLLLMLFNLIVIAWFEPLSTGLLSLLGGTP
jgi:C4-dicarboxylate transporter DctM subunit